MALIINWLIDDANFFSASPMIWQCKLDNLGCQRIGNGRSFGNVNWQVSINGHSLDWKLQLRMVTTPPCYTVVIVGLITVATVTSPGPAQGRDSCCESHLQLAGSSPTKFLGMVDLTSGSVGWRKTNHVHTAFFITTWLWDFETGWNQTILES